MPCWSLPRRVMAFARHHTRSHTRMNRFLSVVLAVAVTAVCLWFLLTPEVLQSLRRIGTDAKPLPIVAAFLVCTLVQWLRAWRYSMMTSVHLNLPDATMVRIAFQ